MPVAQEQKWCACAMNNGLVCARYVPDHSTGLYCADCGHLERCHDHDKFQRATLESAPAHRCPPYCHECPHLGGAVLPKCYGMAAEGGGPNHSDLAFCTCAVAIQCDKEAARRLCESKHLPPELKVMLQRWAETKVRLRQRLAESTDQEARSAP